MLGERLGEEHGKVTTRRVLEGDDYRSVKMEIGFETAVSILGIKGANMGNLHGLRASSGPAVR